MISAGDVETNITAFDWDGDGKAEILMRAMDGTIVYTSDGKAQTIGDPTKKLSRHNPSIMPISLIRWPETSF